MIPITHNAGNEQKGSSTDVLEIQNLRFLQKAIQNCCRLIRIEAKKFLVRTEGFELRSLKLYLLQAQFQTKSQSQTV